MNVKLIICSSTMWVIIIISTIASSTMWVVSIAPKTFDLVMLGKIST